MKKRYFVLAKCYDKKGKLLSVGFNSYQKTHPIQKFFARGVGNEQKEYLHAEIAAIIRARDHAIYRITIERYNNQGFQANARPCPVCQEAIQAYGIKVVEFTSEECVI